MKLSLVLLLFVSVMAKYKIYHNDSRYKYKISHDHSMHIVFPCSAPGAPTMTSICLPQDSAIYGMTLVVKVVVLCLSN